MPGESDCWPRVVDRNADILPFPQVHISLDQDIRFQSIYTHYGVEDLLPDLYRVQSCRSQLLELLVHSFHSLFHRFRYPGPMWHSIGCGWWPDRVDHQPLFFVFSFAAAYRIDRPRILSQVSFCCHHFPVCRLCRLCRYEFLNLFGKYIYSYNL